MTIQDFIDKEVRPIIGDSYPTHSYPKPIDTQTQQPNNQIVKYPAEVLLALLNEGVLDISTHSKLFKVRSYLLIGKDTKVIQTPEDFKGLYKVVNASGGTVGREYSTDMPEILIKPTFYGLELESSITDRDISTYQNAVSGIAVPSDIVDTLIKSGQITLDANYQNVLFDILAGKVLVEYWYLAEPKEYTLEDTIEDRELRYLLKWWTASRAVVLDLHNEANTLYKLYESFYLRRLETAGETVHNWNTLSLSPFSPINRR